MCSNLFLQIPCSRWRAPSIWLNAFVRPGIFGGIVYAATPLVWRHERDWQDRFWRRRVITGRRMRSQRIVVDAPPFDERFGFLHRVKYLSGEQLISEFGVEARIRSTLSGSNPMDCRDRIR